MGKSAIAILVLALLPATAGGAALYKSIAPNGTVTFSDMPPAGDARIVEQRMVPEGRAAEAGMPRVIGGAEPLLDVDGAIARANAQVDLAEHALAVARRELWSPREGLRLASRRMTRADEERVEFYKKNLRIARQQLMDLLRERRAMAVAQVREPNLAIASR